MLNVEIKSAGSSAQSHAAPQWAEGDEEGDRGEEERGLQRWRRRRVGWRTGSCRIIKCSSHGCCWRSVWLWNCGVTSGQTPQWPLQPEPRLPGLQQHAVGHVPRGKTECVHPRAEGRPGGWSLPSGGGGAGWDGGGVHRGENVLLSSSLSTSVHVQICDVLNGLWCLNGFNYINFSDHTRQ